MAKLGTRHWMVAVAFSGLLVGALALSAEALTLELTTEFSGATAPTGTPPWGTATFTDAGAGTVNLTLQLNLQGAQEFLTAWYFNFDPTLNAGDLIFAYQAASSTGPAATVNLGTDAFQADGDGLYDIFLDFPPPPGSFASKFTGTETVVYQITCGDPSECGGFDSESFSFLGAPAGGSGPFFHAAHVQGIGEAGEDSGWVTGDGGNGTVAAPATLLLLGLGLAGFSIAAEVTTRRRARR
jgi:hypothetical protein